MADESIDDLITEEEKPKAKPAADDPGDLDVSSLKELKGKTLDDEVLSTIESVLKRTVESESDSRVSRARKNWENEMERMQKEGKLLSADDFEKRLEMALAKERKLTQRKTTLRETLKEEGITTKEDDKSFDAFTKAYKQGLKNDDWSPEILHSRGGIRTVLQAAGLLKSQKEEAEKKEKNPLTKLPPEGVRIGKDGKPIDTEQMSPDEKRREMMRKAIEGGNLG